MSRGFMDLACNDVMPEEKPMTKTRNEAATTFKYIYVYNILLSGFTFYTLVYIFYLSNFVLYN